MADIGAGGWSKPATTSSVSTRPAASATAIVSAGSAVKARVMRVTASSTEIIAVPSSVAFPAEHGIDAHTRGLGQALGGRSRQRTRSPGKESVQLVHRYGCRLCPLGRPQALLQHEAAQRVPFRRWIP